MRVAADDLRREGRLHVAQVEHALLRGELRVQHDLEQQVAELAGELGRGPGLERVVDLVGLLEQVVPQRRVGLLAVPRAAVGLAEAVADPGHRPRAGEPRPRARPAPTYRGAARSSAASAPTVVLGAVPNRPTGWSAG